MGTKRFARASIAIAVGALAALLPLGTTPAQAASALFGHPCSSGGQTTGDFNNDGLRDLAIGAPGDGVEQIEVDGSITKTGNKVGSINVVYSSASANGPDPKSTVPGRKFFSQNTPGMEDEAETDDTFGFSLASGDFDGIGGDDLAIGVPGENSARGAVHILYSAAPPTGQQTTSGLNADFDHVITQDTGSILGTGEPGDLFGYSLAAGDVNGDGRDDLVVGAPKEDISTATDAGVFHVIYGTASGLRTAGNQVFEQGPGAVRSPEIGRAERGDFFGASLAVGQFDVRRGMDVAAGAPAEDIGGAADAGAVRVLFSSGGVLSTTGAKFFHAAQPGMLGSAETGDRFGCSLAAGDFDGDGGRTTPAITDDDDDLAVGAPGESIGDADNAGAVGVLYNVGSPNGIGIGGNEVWTEDQGGIPGVAKADDRMGASLAAADFDGNGADDLAVGLPTEMLFGNKSAGSIRVLSGIVGAGLSEASPYAFAQSPSDPESNCWLYGITDRCGGLPPGPPAYSPLYMVEEENDLFGASLAAADFDNDGLADLAIGAPGEDLGQFVNWVLEEELTIPDELLTNFGIPVPLSVDEVSNAGIVHILMAFNSATGPDGFPTSTNTPAADHQDLLYRDSGGRLNTIRDDVLHEIPILEPNEIDAADSSTVLTDDAFGHDQS